MKLQYFVFMLNLLSTCHGRRDLMTKISVKYLRHRKLNFVCLFTCENLYSAQRFTKQLNNELMATGIVNINRQHLNYEKIKQCLKQKYAAIGIIIDGNCKNTEMILHYASREMYVDTQRKWLIFDQSNTTVITKAKKRSPFDSKSLQNDDKSVPPIMSILSGLNLSFNLDITVALQEGNQDFTLIEILNYGKLQGGKLILINLGRWSLIKAQDLNVLNDYAYYRRWNFNKLMLRMVVVMPLHQNDINRKFVSEEQGLAGVAQITQTSLMILKVVAEIHNFKYRYSIVDRWIGNYVRNSTATVTNLLFFKDQDISPVIRLSKSTCEHVDIINTPVTSIETRYYYKIPTHGAGKFENQFLRSLSTGTWLCLLGVSLVCATVLGLTSRFERRPASAQYAFFSVLASICQQFFEDNSEVAVRRTTTAGKMTILVTGASCVLIYNYYASSVVSWLLNGPPPSINSLRELLESPLELIFEDIGYTRSWLQMPDYYYNKRNAKVEDELRQKKVFNKKKRAPLFVPLERGIEMVKAGGYAYHTEVDNANTIISRTFSQSELCELGSLQSMEETLLYACLQKDSPYKEFFTWSLLRLLECGIVSCIQDRTRSPEVFCEGSSPRALALGGAAPAFIMLAVGYCLGFVVMLMERIHYNVQRRMEISF